MRTETLLFSSQLIHINSLIHTSIAPCSLDALFLYGEWLTGGTSDPLPPLVLPVFHSITAGAVFWFYLCCSPSQSTLSTASMVTFLTVNGSDVTPLSRIVQWLFNRRLRVFNLPYQGLSWFGAPSLPCCCIWLPYLRWWRRIKQQNRRNIQTKHLKIFRNPWSWFLGWHTELWGPFFDIDLINI